MFVLRTPPSHFYFPVIPSERGNYIANCKNVLVKLNLADYKKVEVQHSEGSKIMAPNPREEASGACSTKLPFPELLAHTALPLCVLASPISSFPGCWFVLPPRLLFWISVIHRLPPSSPHPTPVWPFI